MSKSEVPDRTRTRTELSLELGEQDDQLLRSEAVYRALKAAIQSGKLRPGDRLREEVVAKQLNVSRTPVREAFGRLIARKFVESGAGKGLIVRSLEASEIRDLYAMREILEGAAAALAASHASSAEIEHLGVLCDLFEAATNDPSRMAQINIELHDVIFQAARNSYLNLALRDLQDFIAMLGQTTFSVAGRPQTAIQEHRAIVKAINDRDAERAEQLARAHIRAALRARLTISR